MTALPPVDLSPYFMTMDELTSAPIDWVEFFGNDHPIEIEIGTGRGLFLVNAGLMHPHTNFLGVEYDYKEARRAARRMQKRELSNVRILGANARIAMPKYLPTATAAAMHVYFPDPWWKRRHRKRRIYQPEFVAEIARIVKPGGLLHSWTDVEEYFHVIIRMVESNPAFVRMPEPAAHEPKHDMDYHTSFERKKRKMGLPIFRAQWQRK